MNIKLSINLTRKRTNACVALEIKPEAFTAVHESSVEYNKKSLRFGDK